MSGAGKMPYQANFARQLLPPPVWEALARGGTVLTGNQRAARTLREQYNAHQQAEGATGWQPPAIYAWDTWLELLWRQLVVGGRASALLLNIHQEHAVWRDIVAADEALAPTLRSSDSLAELAANGWQLLNRFGARRQVQRYSDTIDNKAFVRWMAEFERRAARELLLSRARLPEVLSDAVQRGEFTGAALPGLLLVGFDRKTPDQESLLAAVAAAGTLIQEVTISPAVSPGHLAAAATGQAELEACARWVREQLTARPEAQVAVVVPRLADLRSRIDRAFREIIAPELEDIQAPTVYAPWEFSLGMPLASTAPVSAALDLLEWGVGPLPVERISRLLLSPYFAGGGEHLARAEFDSFTLRRNAGLLAEVTVTHVLRLADRSAGGARLPILQKSAHAAVQLLNKVKPEDGKRSYGSWCGVFGQLLDAWDWGAGRPNGSVEFQIRRRWTAVLDELASLDFDGRTVSYPDALKELRRIAEGTLFAPESHDAPVQVMGALEAAGSQYDAVWFLGAGDLSWPGAAAPHPLLPLRLQRELAMPGTDPAQEMAQARTIAERIRANAEQVIFSYAREAEESQQRPSPALNGLDLNKVRVEDLLEARPARLPVRLEKQADDVELSALPDEIVRGGSNILKLQAACGFRAFAEIRLHSTMVDTPEAGLDAMERGNLVHKVLEAVWSELGDQNALKALSEEQRKALLARHIDVAMEWERRTAVDPWSAAYLDTERERLWRLLGSWLKKEMERPPFAVTLHEQEVQDVSIGPLRLEVRLDRVDVLLKDGEPAGEIVLDYKTGSVKTSDWNGDRPDDPQVPLYALVRKPEELLGVAFGSVRPGNGMALSGLQAEKNVLTTKGGSLVDLPARVEEWRGVLTALAEEYAAGNATVSPKQYPTTCRYCEQRLVCRLDPKTLEPENLEDLADPDPSYDAEAEIA